MTAQSNMSNMTVKHDSQTCLTASVLFGRSYDVIGSPPHDVGGVYFGSQTPLEPYGATLSSRWSGSNEQLDPNRGNFLPKKRALLHPYLGT